MARIRTVKPDFFRHLGLFKAEKKYKLPLRVAFAGLFTCADRDGKFKWLPEELKLDCLPHDKVNFEKVLTALAETGFIVKYEVNRREYAYIPSFNEHQKIRTDEAKSILPDPPPVTNPIEPVTNPLESESWKGRERKGIGKEGEGKGDPSRDSEPINPRPQTEEKPPLSARPPQRTNWRNIARHRHRGDKGVVGLS